MSSRTIYRYEFILSVKNIRDSKEEEHMTCNLHEIIRRYTLPVARQNEPVIHFLPKYYDRLLKKLTDSAKAGFDDFPSTVSV